MNNDSQKSHEDYVKVADVMTSSVHKIGSMSTVREAVSLLREHGIRALVVDRRDASDEYGLVAVVDIAREVIGKNLSPDRVNVYEIMTKPVLSLPADMNIVYAVRMLSRFHLTRAVVIDAERHPVGIVTLRDMVIRHIGDE